MCEENYTKMQTDGEAAVLANAIDPVQLKPFELLDDIFNAVNDYTAEGFNALEECLLSNIPMDDFQARLLLQGSAHLFRQLQTDLAQHLQEFERAALRSSLSIPAGLILDTPPTDSRTLTAEHEEQLDAELARLRAQIQQARQNRQHLESQIMAIDREIRSYGDASDLAAVAAVAEGKENLAEDALALATKAVELAQMLPEVQAKQAARDKAPGTFSDAKHTALSIEKGLLQRQAAMGSAKAEDLRAIREQLPPNP